ncbi:MAG: methionine--tRNA ligase [Candidatus Parvarchaeota archaeon]|nr:methionine--tRNA ligase [Candidatus Jingweiarchaeum tengchongense]MCW1309691.1 methionine--tRNA ligase [Candidatus Jingweiarchaeum tengchongense]
MVVEYKRFLITAALPYANGELHLGHIMSTYLPADIITRFLRLNKKDAIYICATDEHGTPILIKAEEEKKTPEEFVKYWHKRDKEEFEKLGIKFDIFYRTHSKENETTAQEFFLKLYNKKYIFKKEVEQFYCESCKKFLPDRYVKGTCPYCKSQEQYSDYCEKCGKAIGIGEIEDPHCAVCKSKPIKKKSIHYFFKLSSFSKKLRKYLLKNKNLQAEIRNYVINWIDSGLQDWDITRDISWGIKIPLKEAGDKTLYVWFEAPICYISSTKKWSQLNKKDWKKFWKSKDCCIMHFIGKDIVYHHYLFWPAILMGVNNGFLLPSFIPVRGHLTLEGEKFSKSRGLYVSLKDYLEKYDPDYLRFYMSLITTYSASDVNFSWKEYQQRINTELVNIIGNFIYRTTFFIYKFFNSRVPKLYQLDEKDKEILNELKIEHKKITENLNKIEIQRALQEIIFLAGRANKYFQEKEPWRDLEKRKKEISNCLNISMNLCRALSIYLYPFIPFSIEKLWKQINIKESEQDWKSAYKLKIKANHHINEPFILFKKIEDDVIEKEIAKLGIKQENRQEVKKEVISFEEFKKMDLRVGRVMDAEKVAGTDKLIKMTVDFGELGKRTVVAGIAKFYEPEDLVNKQFVFVTNLEPKKMRGILSEAMILAAVEGDEEKIALVGIEKEVKEGTPVQ